MGALHKKRFSAGFTVTELVVVMTIVGILTAIGTPTFKYVTTSNRIAGEVNGLLGDLQFARTEAIKNGAFVSVCVSSASLSYLSCSPAGTTTWQTGWIVFLDLNGNGKVDAGDTVLRTQAAFSGTDTFLAGSNLSVLTYNRMGYAPTLQAATVNISLHNSTSTQNFTRCLAVTPIGSASTEVYGAGSPVCN
jgi:type IV fimbrial biogenesis protein FimT